MNARQRIGTRRSREHPRFYFSKAQDSRSGADHRKKFDFTLAHSPGHTNYQMTLFAVIDGARITFTDAIFDDAPKPAWSYLRQRNKEE